MSSHLQLSLAGRKPGHPGDKTPGPIPIEALKFFESKGLKPSFDYDEVWAHEYRLAFMVAKIMEIDLLSDVQDSLARALKEGQTFRDWSKGISDTFDKSGWSSYGTEEQKPSRLLTIFDTNMRMARSEGFWQRVNRTEDALPFLEYNLGPSIHHREEHAAWEGTVLPADHPWWADHSPPLDYGCKCWLRQLTAKEAQDLGIDEAPPTELVEWENIRTGETTKTPMGVNPTFAYPRGGAGGREQALSKALQDREEEWNR